MNSQDAAEIYALCCATWGEMPTKIGRLAWENGLANVDRPVAEARIQALVEDRQRPPFMPKLPELVAGPRQEQGAVHRNGRMFLPGTGWIGGGHPDDANGPPALPPAPDPSAGIAGARDAMRSARAATARARAAAGPDPAIVRQVDEAARRLRMPEDPPSGGDEPGEGFPSDATPPATSDSHQPDGESSRHEPRHPRPMAGPVAAAAAAMRASTEDGGSTS